MIVEERYVAHNPIRPGQTHNCRRPDGRKIHERRKRNTGAAVPQKRGLPRTMEKCRWDAVSMRGFLGERDTQGGQLWTS